VLIKSIQDFRCLFGRMEIEVFPAMFVSVVYLVIFTLHCRCVVRIPLGFGSEAMYI